MPSSPPVGSLCPSTYTDNHLQYGRGNPSHGTGRCPGNNPNYNLDQGRAEAVYCYGYRRGQGAAEQQPLLMWTIKKKGNRILKCFNFPFPVPVISLDTAAFQ